MLLHLSLPLFFVLVFAFVFYFVFYLSSPLVGTSHIARLHDPFFPRLTNALLVVVNFGIEIDNHHALLIFCHLHSFSGLCTLILCHHLVVDYSTTPFSSLTKERGHDKSSLLLVVVAWTRLETRFTVLLRRKTFHLIE